MEIIQAPNPILNQKTKPIKKTDKQILELIDELKEILLTTRDPKGVGLAAPQVGKSLQIFIAKPWPSSPLTIFINPQIIWRSEEKTDGVPQRKNKNPSLRSGTLRFDKSKLKFEGCLSIPDIWGTVHRAKRVKLRYQLIINNHKLITRTRTFSGFLATIIQHEVDHLDGILFTQRVLEQKEKLYKVIKDKNGKDIFEEINI